MGEIKAIRKARAHLDGYVEIPKTKSISYNSDPRHPINLLHYTDVDPCDPSNQDSNGGPKDGKRNRVVVFLGKTGAGKTTLIQSMTNFLMKVDYDEPLRYELICEQHDEDIDKDPTKSQTVDIHQYHMQNIPAMPNDSMTIVDTPGFGDTSGPDQDLIIRDKFQEFFGRVDYIDAIYFVMQACTTRVGAGEKYLFNMVLDLFGKDVVDNIFMLFTFADGKDPPALKAVEAMNIPYSGYFKINNSGFSMPEKKDITHRAFYGMGCDMFGEMFKHLRKTNPVSTEMSVMTLQERNNITTRLHHVGQFNKTLLSQKANAEKEFIQLKKMRNEMENNKNFTIEVTDTKVRFVKVKYNTTYCPTCVMSCHPGCAYGDGEDKEGCGAMVHAKYENGNYIRFPSHQVMCGVCPKKCHWSNHKNTHDIVERYEVKRKETKESLKEKYDLAGDKKASIVDIMVKILEKMQEQQEQIKSNIQMMKSSVQRLQDIALNDKVLTEDEYFDTLIDAEQKEKKLGWNDRVKQLKKLKESNANLRRYTSGDGVLSPVQDDEDFQKLIEELQAENVPPNKLESLKNAYNEKCLVM